MIAAQKIGIANGLNRYKTIIEIKLNIAKNTILRKREKSIHLKAIKTLEAIKAWLLLYYNVYSTLFTDFIQLIHLFIKNNRFNYSFWHNFK